MRVVVPGGVVAVAPRVSPLVILGSVLAAVTVLAVAKAVLVPIALAIYLTFVLSPIQRGMQRLGLNRAVSVVLTMILALGALGGFAATLAFEVEDLASQVSQYANSMRLKMGSLRSVHPGALSILKSTADRVGKELDDQAVEVKSAAPVRIVAGERSALDRVVEAVQPLMGPLAFSAIVLVLVTFMLSQREDLRDRVIRIVGRGKVTLTTRTMDEAVHRISRFLLALSLINLGFGALVAAGLTWIGIPYALLWGSLAALLRFVPYAGSLLAVAMPMLLAFARFPGWSHTLQTLGLFIGLDITAGSFVEPLVVGNRTGVSSLALLVSSLFWTWLWGPVGLVLATPLTVCVAVLGRHVPQLHFLSIALRDQPALEPATRLYQRLLARDAKEASSIARRFAREHGHLALVDQVLVEGLAVAMRDRDGADIASVDFAYVVTAIRALASSVLGKERGSPAASAPPARSFVGLAVQGDADEAVLELLGSLNKGAPWESVSKAGSPVERVALAVGKKPSVVCIASLPPAGAARARFFCRLIRKNFPSVRILVLRPAAEGDDMARAAARLREAGADWVVGTVAEAQAHLAQA